MNWLLALALSMGGDFARYSTYGGIAFGPGDTGAEDLLVDRTAIALRAEAWHLTGRIRIPFRPPLREGGILNIGNPEFRLGYRSSVPRRNWAIGGLFSVGSQAFVEVGLFADARFLGPGAWWLDAGVTLGAWKTAWYGLWARGASISFALDWTWSARRVIALSFGPRLGISIAEWGGTYFGPAGTSFWSGGRAFAGFEIGTSFGWHQRLPVVRTDGPTK